MADNKRLNQANSWRRPVADGGEHGVDRIAGLAGEMVAVHSVFCFGMADDRLDRRPSPHLTLDRVGHPALLAGSIVALVAGVAKNALKQDADLLLDRGDDGAERVAIIGLGLAKLLRER